MASDALKELQKTLPEGVYRMIAAALPEKLSDSKAKEFAKKVADEYSGMKVEPGESVGLVAAESIGEPGTQMSIRHDEQVVVRTPNAIQNFAIGEFVDSVLARYGFKRLANPEETEVFHMPKGADFHVPSLGMDEKIVWKRITAVSRHKAPAKLLKLMTRSGRKIAATPYHSFVIRRDNRVVPVSGSSLGKGDRIPVVRAFPVENCRSSLALEEFLPKEKYIYGSELQKAINGNSRLHRAATVPLGYEQINNYANSSSQILVQEGFVYPRQNHSRAEIPETIPLDSLFGWLVGAYLAEGVHVENSIGISNVSEAYLAKASQFAAKYKIGCGVKREMGEFGPSATLWMHSTVLADLLRLAAGKTSAHKRVPGFAFDSNEDFITALLQAYFDGDGNVSVTRNVIRASSNSEELIDGISLLLARLGIFSVKNSDKKGQYWLSSSYRHSKRFFEKIGSVIPEKSAALVKLVKKLELAEEREKSYDVIDMIPGYGLLFAGLGKKLGLPSRLVTKLTRKQKVGRAALARYAKNFSAIAAAKGIGVSEEIGAIRKMLDSDVVWDEIVELEYVEPGAPFVYDFSVEETETFTTFDGIVTHNTLDTFHFAGVSEMNVTMGLPRIIEILDGRKKLATPMMEIYLKKPYSEGQDIKKIALVIKETKLHDIATEFSINVADNRVEAQLDIAKMKELGINEAVLAKALKFSAKGVIVDIKGSTLALKVKAKEGGVSDIFKLKEKLKESFVRGVRGVTQVLPVKKNNEYVILTFGSNLKKVMQYQFVDETRTTTNDIFEIEETLGIEAARQTVIDEVYKVIETQGLNVDIRHLMLVADVMCADGKVKGITRYGVVRDKASVLARASFETPIKHIINASLYGDVDKLTSVIENVMLNQPVPVGTGLPKLVSKNK